MSAYMTISVTKAGFIWVSPEGKEYVAQRLYGPHSCGQELLQVVRDKEVVDKATICLIGNHDWDHGFEGFTKISTRLHHRVLTLDMFENGDEIEIYYSSKGSQFSERGYWEKFNKQAA